jgi:hypothetical protein
MGVILAIVVFSHEGADEQEADVREFITTYRTRFTHQEIPLLRV